MNLRAADKDLVGIAVNLKIAEDNAGLAWPCAGSGCSVVFVLLRRLLHALPRLHAQEQLAHAERLHQIVIGSHLEPHHAVDLLAPRSHHYDDRLMRLTAGANPPTYFQARNVWQHEVQQDDIGWLASRQLQRGCAVQCALHLVAGRFQTVG